MLDLLPKAARFVLRILEDFLHARYRIAEHLAFNNFFEKLCFSDAGKEMRDRLFHAIDLRLGDLRDVERLPVFLLEKFRRHLFAIHPFD